MGNVDEGSRQRDVYAPSFAKLIKLHCTALGLTPSKLFDKSREATGAAVHLSYFGRWEEGERSVSRDLAARIAVTIVREYAGRDADKIAVPKEERPTTFGWENLGWTLDRFFAAAGLTSRKVEIAEPKNVAWGRIRSKGEIRVGWVEATGWADKFGGPCIRAAMTMANLLGLKAEFVQLTRWADFAPAIKIGAIDVTAPMVMNTPDRLKDFRFSNPVGKVKFKIGILANKEHFRAKSINLEEQRSGILLGFVEGEVGHLASYLVPPEARHEHPNLDAVVAWLAEGAPKYPRLVAAEAGTLERRALSHSSLHVIDADELKHFCFGVCFAADENEPELIRAIDATLEGGSEYFEKALPDSSPGESGRKKKKV
jgi:ABC-type amino acid transport substrate-binding protein